MEKFGKFAKGQGWRNSEGLWIYRRWSTEEEKILPLPDMTPLSMEVIVADIQVIQRQMSNCVHRFASTRKLMEAPDTPWVKFGAGSVAQGRRLQGVGDTPDLGGTASAAAVGRKTTPGEGGSEWPRARLAEGSLAEASGRARLQFLKFLKSCSLFFRSPSESCRPLLHEPAGASCQSRDA